jgi:hypothetical protein
MQSVFTELVIALAECSLDVDHVSRSISLPDNYVI